MRNFAIFLLALLLTASAIAGTLAGVTLPDKVEVSGQSLVLNGMGLRKKLKTRVYVGGLYLPQKEKSAQAILAADTPRRMVLAFIHDVDQQQMCEAWNEGLEARASKTTPEVKQNIATLCGWLAGAGKGQQLVLTYIPGEGTHVEFAGQAKGILPGKATADAMLATWIGPDPAPGANFKKAILGK